MALGLAVFGLAAFLAAGLAVAALGLVAFLGLVADLGLAAVFALGFLAPGVAALAACTGRKLGSEAELQRCREGKGRSARFERSNSTLCDH